jgi:FAD/FMN-containing dehydrogenase
MARIRLINEGRQVICLPGATLFQLENALKPLGRVPHSVIGSSCIGASVFGGICNNSGGALIHPGPAYTQMALFAGIDDTGEVQLINHIGVRLGNDPETILDRLDRDAFTEADIEYTRTVSPPIMIMPMMSATSTPIRRDASTPIRSASSRPPGAPASNDLRRPPRHFSQRRADKGILYRYERSERAHQSPAAHSCAFQRSAD